MLDHNVSSLDGGGVMRKDFTKGAKSQISQIKSTKRGREIQKDGTKL